MNTLIKLSLITCLGMFFCVPQGIAENNEHHKSQAYDEKNHHNEKRNHTEKYLYVWAGDQAHDSPDFLAVINFDEKSDNYGDVINTVPLPPPGNTNNEPHHCHLSKDKNILACGGLLSLLHNQNSMLALFLYR
jgi:ABC-type nickel/cobalt efflux system permease component RcnA